MTIHYEKYNQEEGSAETAQRGRHQHVQRTFRREAPCAPGQDGNVRRRIRRYARVSTSDILQLGDRQNRSTTGCVPQTCRSLRYFGTDFDAERVSRRLASTILASIFQASGKFANAHVPIFLTWRKFTFPKFKSQTEILKKI